MADDAPAVGSPGADQTFAFLRASFMERYEVEFRARPELASGGQPQIAFQIVTVAALMAAAAEIGVDAGLTIEQARAIVGESWQRANNAAPRFG